MPTVIDATVVNRAHDTSGNGGRKITRLSNGNLYAVVKNSTSWFLYRSTNNGSSWTEVRSVSNSSLQDVCLVGYGTKVYILYSYNNRLVSLSNYDDTTGVLSFSPTIDSNQTALGNVSLAINEAGTELHAAWASRNSTYQNSWNIRYAKGTINADGSVTWGSAVQVTNANISGLDFRNPSVVVVNNVPAIFAERANSGNNMIFIYSPNITTADIVSLTEPSSSLKGKMVYNGGDYPQTSPSACVAPNGRIWVTWFGRDATDSSATNIRVSYSDDGGRTWSPMTKLTSGNTYSYFFPSITVNKNNEVFVLWHGRDDSDTLNDIRMRKYNGSWSGVTVVSPGTTNHKDLASTLYDTTIDFSVPLFIYREQNTKVGFYGIWVVTNISTPQGYIGKKSDKSNILTYSITTDGTMSTITEKINGVTIATRTNPTSGRQFTVSLTHEQWDSIPYGRYAYRNLLPPFTEWNLHPNAIVKNPYELELVATGAWQESSITLNMIEGATYTINISQNGYFGIRFRRSDNSIVGLLEPIVSFPYTFTVPMGAKKVEIFCSSESKGIYTFTNPILTLGSTAKPFVPFGAENTLTIEMGKEKWEYTFDKRLNANDDILSTVKGVHDLQNHLSAVKAQLASAIRAKGGTVNDTDPFSAFVSAVGNMRIKRWASGTGLTSTTGITFRRPGGTTTTLRYLEITGLTFKPSTIILLSPTRLFSILSPILLPGVPLNNAQIIHGSYPADGDTTVTMSIFQLSDGAYVNQNGFRLPLNVNETTVTWYAFE